jgi:thiol-disulfide isomerase/thioredoxin
MHFNLLKMQKLFFLVSILCTLLSCAAPPPERIGIIKGNVANLPTNKVYLYNVYGKEALRTLDSANYTNGHFVFRYPMPEGVDIVTVSLLFYDFSGKKHILVYKNNFSNPGSMHGSFVLEKGTTTITGTVTDLEDLGTNPLELTTTGSETMLFYKYDIGFGSMTGTDSATAAKRIDYYKSIIRQYPRSYFLLERIAKQKYQYTNEQLLSITAPFGKAMLTAKDMLTIQTYMAARPQKGKPVNVWIPLKDANGGAAMAVDTGYALNMVIFWASWCTPCRQEIPLLKKIYGQYQGRGLNMVNISVDEKEALWQKAREAEKMPWPQFWADSTAHQAWRSAVDLLALPTVYFIDKNGVIVSTVIGNDASNAEKFRAIIEKYIQ